MTTRCSWPSTELDIAYHDKEWGVPVHDDRVLFEFITLEGAQAGLSWSTILNKRENYRRAFAGFDPRKVARFTSVQKRKLMRDEGIVRNRLKIESTVTNAQAFLAVQKEFGSFDRYIWQFVGGHDEQGPAEARLPLRRLDHLLRLHAGDGNGQRPSHHLLPPPGAEMRLGGIIRWRPSGFRAR